MKLLRQKDEEELRTIHPFLDEVRSFYFEEVEKDGRKEDKSLF